MKHLRYNYCFKKVSLFIIFLTSQLFCAKSQAQNLNHYEQDLYQLIMRYRDSLGLPKIPLSKSLCIVAKTHVMDLENNNPVKNGCNLHSWSNKGKWTACCYTADHKNAKYMWNKPSELTPYKHNGYEIAYWHSDSADATNALLSWQKSTAHNQVITNQNIWYNVSWKAIGIGIYKHYAVVWFGQEEDTNN